MTEPTLSQVKVYGEAGEPQKYDKVVFQGLPDDAAEFVVNNYPRHHGHIPLPEVYVDHADGKQEHYYGGKWINLHDEPVAETTEEKDDPYA